MQYPSHFMFYFISFQLALFYFQIVKVIRKESDGTGAYVSSGETEVKRPGYEQRRRVNNAGTFIFSDHGTYLAVSTVLL